MSADTGGPAFPVTIGTQDDQHLCGPGMSLRDWFAGMAMQALVPKIPNIADATEYRSGRTEIDWCPLFADAAYTIADAMLKERAR